MNRLEKLQFMAAIAAISQVAEFDDIPDVKREDRYDLKSSACQELPVNLQRENYRDGYRGRKKRAKVKMKGKR